MSLGMSLAGMVNAHVCAVYTKAMVEGSAHWYQLDELMEEPCTCGFGNIGVVYP